MTTTMETLDALNDLRERIASKPALLRELKNGTTMRVDENARLEGKAQGVELALSFIDEHIRMLRGRA